ncbi:lipocalin-like domain protein [Caulobacter sp. Root487D2Y]|uniref:lipocalin-like domain-containing protein n=1 Tax=Caulobacter sp. Root487D2Y TaxID=1736547 RepID=UPI0006FA5458|nr:lipocalin-like domain-containing protein [Caulobacter sp. Root487D2Y]KQY28913.1 lipocalin-like domain protein [Caulobacter sp. Root487D2Y]
MRLTLKACLGAGLALASALSATVATAAEPALAGTWTLTAADRLKPDGARARDYGEHPKGWLIIDARGRYSLQIFDGDRPRVASGDKRTATPEENAGAVLGSSTHYGTVAIDTAAHVLVFRIEGASFANWEGTEQRRKYVLTANSLSYQVPTPRPDGSIPISEWRRER